MATAFAINVSELPPLIRTDVAAKLLSCTERMICKMCANGDIKAVKVGVTWRINTAALLEQFGIQG